jgi:hypothetical protein
MYISDSVESERPGRLNSSPGQLEDWTVADDHGQNDRADNSVLVAGIVARALNADGNDAGKDAVNQLVPDFQPDQSCLARCHRVIGRLSCDAGTPGIRQQMHPQELPLTR